MCEEWDPPSDLHLLTSKVLLFELARQRYTGMYVPPNVNEDFMYRNSMVDFPTPVYEYAEEMHKTGQH